jgi:hypothetical protein
MKDLILDSREAALYDEIEQYKKRWKNEMRRWCK